MSPEKENLVTVGCKITVDEMDYWMRGLKRPD
jgi:hypothetical protein